MSNGLTLFDATRALHGLDGRWRDYLLIALIFRDVGWAVSPIDHAAHSQYILRHIELPLLPWETEVVGELILRQEEDRGELPAKLAPRGKKSIRRSFNRLLALYRVLDALGPAHQTKTPLREVSAPEGELVLRVSGREAEAIVSQRLEYRKTLFERVFARQVRVVSGRTAVT